jgi:hypothetical protein
MPKMFVGYLLEVLVIAAMIDAGQCYHNGARYADRLPNDVPRSISPHLMEFPLRKIMKKDRDLYASLQTTEPESNGNDDGKSAILEKLRKLLLEHLLPNPTGNYTMPLTRNAFSSSNCMLI